MKKTRCPKKKTVEKISNTIDTVEQSCILGHIPIVESLAEREREVHGLQQSITANEALEALEANKKDVVKRFIRQQLDETPREYQGTPLITSIPMKHLDGLCVDDDVVCWWCCHPFTTSPVYIPHWVDDGVFGVTGHFCSFPCALSYNHSQRDEHAYHRENMLVLMYRCHGRYDVLIPAPPRESLKIFGGWLTVDDFRSTNTIVRLIKPPIQSLRYMIETDDVRTNVSTGSSYPVPKAYVPLSGDHVNRAKESLRLKRNAPKKTQYVSMEETLGLVKRKVN